MPTPTQRLLTCATALAFAVAAPSQSPRPAERAAGVAANTAAFAGVMEHDGALLGTAHGYRASFGERGVEYLPALGRHAPRAEPWHVHLVEVRRGGQPVATTQDISPRRTHDRRTVTYHWPSLDERYEATADGLLQSFHFARPLGDRGELAVRLAVATALPPRAGEPPSWRHDAGGGVTLGGVTGIDALGRRCDGTARLVDGGYELSLPAWFVDTAAWPLVVDPLIGTATEALASADCDFPDVAYDAFSQTYGVCWTQFFGGGTTGAVGSVFRASDLALQYAFAVNQPGDEDSVRITNIAGSGLFVMAWTNWTSAGGHVSGLAFDPGQAQATNVWTVYGPAAVAAPMLSGEATVFDDDCLLLWRDDQFGLLGTTIAIDAQWQVSATPIVQLAGGNVAEAAVSKQGGSPGVHLVTWVDRPPGLPGWVRAQAVDHDLNLLGPATWLHNAPDDAGFPAVDGDGFVFLVAWEQQEVQNPSAYDIRGRLVTAGQSGITSLGNPLPLAIWPNDLDLAPDVAMLGDKFGLCYQSQAQGFGDDCWFRVLSRAGQPIGGELQLDVTPGTSYRYEHAPRLIGRRDGDPATSADDGLVVFADQNVQTADSNVGLQAVEAMGPGGPVQSLGGGCGPGGLASANGPAALGNTTFACELFGAQALAIPFVLVALPGPQQTCGVCTVLQPLSATFAPNLAGYSVSPLPMPGDPVFVGLAFDVQFVTFLVNYVGCPTAPGVAASNVLRVTVGT